MPGFLLHLQGSMQSWADTGFGQLREAGLFPSRAAVLGIIAAAHGIPRADDQLVALHDAFNVHVATVRSGRVLKDFHTVETDPNRNKTLTWRDYRHDAHFVALLESDDADVIGEAVRALNAPVYTSFLGRRSCPPSTPLRPERVEGDGFEALRDTTCAAMKALPVTGEKRWGGSRNAEVVIYLDGHFIPKELPAPFESVPVTYGTRRDRLVAPKRAYVNRPYTRLTLDLPADLTDPQQAYFDAAS